MTDTPAGSQTPAQPAPQPTQDQQPQPDADTQPDTATDAVDAADESTEQDTEDDGGQDNDDQDDGSDKSRASRREARYRVQLRETKDALVATTAALGLQQQAMVDQTVTAAGFDSGFSKLLDAKGFDLDSLLDDSGLVSPGKVNEAITETARAFNLRPRTRPKPAPGQGMPSDQSGTASWSDVLGDAVSVNRGK